MCCPGSSESGSGVQCTGIVTGTVTITGAPKSFTPGYVGVGACPVTGSSGGCANPTSYLTGNGGTYSLTLAAGGWKITPFYEINPYGGAFLGKSAVVTVPAGGTGTQNFTVPLKNAAAVVGAGTRHNPPPT